MVAIIKSHRSAKRSCLYNESKVSLGQANLIMAGNYPCEPEDLTRRQRMMVLQKRLDLNERCYKSSLHIVLSFHADDKLSSQQLGKISQTYMDQIGLSQQPFLVYQHLDTLHPHLHLVTVTIKADGSGNRVFHARQSFVQNVREQIEKQYKLTASSGSALRAQKLQSAQRLQYGKLPAAMAISQVLSVVLPDFKYCTITELNAVLRHYNLVANQGKPGSKTRLHLGLSYQMLTQDGKKTGSPVKASRLDGKPTLAYLQQRFKANSIVIALHTQRIRTLIDLALIVSHSGSLAELGSHLSKEGVKTVYAFTPAGQLYEIIFVDFRSRSACSASRLGARYTPFELQKRLAEFERSQDPALGNNPLTQPLPWQARTQNSAGQGGEKQSGEPAADESLLKILLDPAPEADYLPWELKKLPRKKRRQISLQL
ncbi:relaxase/mobilization nuclease domain-containing protein [Dyadobacter jiangsuensis]